MSRWRQTTLRAARAAGLEPRLRRVQAALEPKTARRDRRDNEHLRVLLAGALAADADCIDVGANVGEVLSDIVRLAPRGRHIAYEPLPDLAERLRERFPGVEVRNAALSDHEGEATFHRVKRAAAHSSLSPLDHSGDELEPFTVALETLDSSLPDGLAPAFVKIDVEGAEEQVLLGALETLRAHQPIVVLEHGAGAAYFGTTSERIHELLGDGAGLRVFDILGNGPLDGPAFAAEVAGGEVWTFVARA